VLAQLLAFLGVAAVVIVVPGPDTALTVRNALAGGRRRGVATAAGVATGQAVWTLATGVGVAELLQASEPAFLVMKTAGAAYLVFLGLQSLWAAAGAPSLRAAGAPSFWAAGARPLWTAARIGFPGRLRSPTGGPGAGRGGYRTPPGGYRTPPGGYRTSPGGAQGFRQGVVSNLANPKMAAFFLSLLPQFVAPGAGAAGVVGLGLVFCVMTFGWLALYSVAVDRARVVLGRSWVRRVLDGVGGVVLVGFGARLALQQR
jgi:threonine/homoserine/homoserine lactone efflux protein